MPVRLSELAASLGLELRGEDRDMSGLATLEAAGPDDISFLANKKYAQQLETTRAGCVICQPRFAERVSCALVSDNPYLTLAHVARRFATPQGLFEGVSPLAFVHEDAELGEGVDVGPFAYVAAGARLGDGARLYPHAYVGEEASIGEGSTLYPHATVMARVVVGKRCTLHPGAVVGADGFGYAPSDTGMVKIEQLGSVVLGDDVDVGACATIDRGSMGDTTVGQGTKIDNQVMLAHNVEIGPHSALAGQTGIAGSTRVGMGVQMGGKVGIAGHVKIGDGVMIATRSGIAQDVPDGSIIGGNPAVDLRQARRIWTAQNKLPEYAQRLRALEQEIEELKARISGDDANGG
jgi:UDP-3-O-[3-hydroxymyristoyl] glucosamine N-acyltransferase